MAITNAALPFMAQASIGTAASLFTEANSYIGVGDSTTAFAKTQTDLQGTNKLRKKVDAGYPTISGSTLTFRATFTTSEANFAWNEWGVFNAASAGTMLNRVVQYNGTKVDSQTWVFTVTVTFGN